MYEVGHTIKRTFADGDSWTFKIIDVKADPNSDVNLVLKVKWISVDYREPSYGFVNTDPKEYTLPFQDVIICNNCYGNWDIIINYLTEINYESRRNIHNC